MLLLVLATALLVLGVAYVVQGRSTANVSNNGRPERPREMWQAMGASTTPGAVAVWSLFGAVALQVALAGQVRYAGVPLSVLAFVLALVALTRYHDRSPVVVLTLAVALFTAVFPVAFSVFSTR
jgi:hypothetical protein